MGRLLMKEFCSVLRGLPQRHVSQFRSLFRVVEQNKNAIDPPTPLEGEQASQYRAFAARCNYVAVGLADAQHCIKEFCRDMSAPTIDSWKRLIR